MKLGNAGSQTTENYFYNSDRLQLTGQSVVNSAGATLMNLTYNYQAAAGASGVGTNAGNSGQLMSITGTINGQSRAQSFTYDDVGRLVTATGWGAWQRRFEYDRWGNRTGVWDATVGGSQIQSIALQQQAGSSPPAPSNRMQTVTQGGSTLTQTYDAAGNLTNDGMHAYRYDAEGRLARVDAGTANEAVYTYDANNWRVKKVVGTGASAVTTYYVWEGAVVIAEYSTAAPSGSGGLRFYHPDRLSTRMITDSNGVVKGTQDHLPFGEDSGTVGEVEKHRFTNYERDSESGTDYAVNRQYSQATGRFTRPDPAGGSGFNPQSLNRYAYSLGDPINLSDPLGLESPPPENTLLPPIWASGPGLYIDGFLILPGQEGLFLGLLSSGAAAVAPFGATVTMRAGGSTWISINTGVIGSDPIRLGTLDIEVAREWNVQGGGSVPITLQSTLDTAFSLAKRILKKNKACRELLSTDIMAHPFAIDAVSESNLVRFLKRMKKHRLYYTTAPLGEVVADTTGIFTSAFVRVGPMFFEPSVGNWVSLAGSTRRAQVKVILHELGHATGAAAADHYQAPTNATAAQRERQRRETEAYNRRIVTECLRGSGIR
ncbi:MAG TPA: RHS repeat-associated core domain-containing protein [Blastocatellia bacterium]|nr:RHS repeat-associated core domain-containing protein [Blastocatellia bacterium]